MVSLLLITLFTTASTLPAIQTIPPTYYYKKPHFKVLPDVENTQKLESGTVFNTTDKMQTAVDYMMKDLQISDRSQFKKTDVLESESTLTYHCNALVDNLPVVNSHAVVNVNALNQVISISSSWVDPNRLAKRAVTKVLSPTDAVVAFARQMGYEVDRDTLVESVGSVEGETFVIGASFTGEKITTSEKYYRTETSLEKVIEISAPVGTNWHNAFISVEDQRIVGLTDFTTSMFYDEDRITPQLKETTKHNSLLSKRAVVAGIPDTVTYTGDFKYKALGLNHGDVTEGFVIFTNPADSVASPKGWHNDGDQTGDFPTTIGNNVVAQDNDGNADRTQVIRSGGRPQSTTFNFVFPDVVDKQNPFTYASASVTNVFVTTNLVHDLLYKYGFNEKSGNFQNDNGKNGGIGNDAIIANSQDGSGTNNANFATPPDGSSGLMRMFIFNRAGLKDGSLDNTVISHELFHGVSTRITGGPANSRCLKSAEAAGMGEGWSDFFALLLNVKTNQSRTEAMSVGKYVTGKDRGVRRFQYSTSTTVNPRKYSDLNGIANGDVHSTGEVWAIMLFEVMWNMIDRRGFASNLATSVNSGRGNSEILQLILDGMKLQACNPSFIQARDAILLADKQAGGQHSCDIWTGFAKRGLGINAKDDGTFVDGFDAPACPKAAPQRKPALPKSVIKPGQVVTANGTILGQIRQKSNGWSVKHESFFLLSALLLTTIVFI